MPVAVHAAGSASAGPGVVHVVTRSICLVACARGMELVLRFGRGRCRWAGRVLVLGLRRMVRLLSGVGGYR